jgi:ribonuclease VapC
MASQMASGVVLDTSAVLAYIFGEPGAVIVETHMEQAAVCSVNWSEVVQKYLARGASLQALRPEIDALGVQIVPFSADDAERCALLWRRTHPSGLSLADRACLSLAQRLRVPTLTADHDWARLDLGVEVRLIR